MNLAKYVPCKVLPLLKQRKEDLNKWRNIPAHGLEDSVMLQSALLKLVYLVNTITIKQALF